MRTLNPSFKLHHSQTATRCEKQAGVNRWNENVAPKNKHARESNVSNCVLTEDSSSNCGEAFLMSLFHVIFDVSTLFK